LYDTVTEAMQACEALGMTWIGRYDDDDAPIVGVWV